jgi:hypothetical protein
MTPRRTGLLLLLLLVAAAASWLQACDAAPGTVSAYVSLPCSRPGVI